MLKSIFNDIIQRNLLTDEEKRRFPASNEPTYVLVSMAARKTKMGSGSIKNITKESFSAEHYKEMEPVCSVVTYDTFMERATTIQEYFRYAITVAIGWFVLKYYEEFASDYTIPTCEADFKTMTNHLNETNLDFNNLAHLSYVKLRAKPWRIYIATVSKTLSKFKEYPVTQNNMRLLGNLFRFNCTSPFAVLLLTDAYNKLSPASLDKFQIIITDIEKHRTEKGGDLEKIFNRFNKHFPVLFNLFRKSVSMYMMRQETYTVFKGTRNDIDPKETKGQTFCMDCGRLLDLINLKHRPKKRTMYVNFLGHYRFCFNCDKTNLIDFKLLDEKRNLFALETIDRPSVTLCYSNGCSNVTTTKYCEVHIRKITAKQ